MRQMFILESKKEMEREREINEFVQSQPRLKQTNKQKLLLLKV